MAVTCHSDGTHREARVLRRVDIADLLALPGMAVAVARIL